MDDVHNGVWLRLAAAFLITAMSALVREVSDDVTLGQIIFWRSAVAIIPICIYMALRGDFPAPCEPTGPACISCAARWARLRWGCPFCR